jgi:hypothetical protein
MRQLTIILIISIAWTGCKKEKNQLDKFAFDKNQIAFREVHKYSFNKNGKIAVDRSTSYYYMAGVVFDSITYETHFQYNTKGKLISAVELPDTSRQIKIYNNLDSLVGDYRINQYGDTTFLTVTVYDQNKIVRRINRNLQMKLSNTSLKKEGLRNYDTLLLVTDLIYENGKHIRSLSRDKTGMVIGETEQFYEGNQLTKTLAYAFLGDTKYLSETTYYKNKGDQNPDFFSIGTQGDTVAMKKTTFKSDGKAILDYNKKSAMQGLWYYDNANKLLATVMVDLSAREKTVSKYTYDNRGNKIEEVTFKVSLDPDK